MWPVEILYSTLRADHEISHVHAKIITAFVCGLSEIHVRRKMQIRCRKNVYECLKDVLLVNINVVEIYTNYSLQNVCICTIRFVSFNRSL